MEPMLALKPIIITEEWEENPKENVTTFKFCFALHFTSLAIAVRALPLLSSIGIWADYCQSSGIA